MDKHNKYILYLVMVLTIIVLTIGIRALLKNKSVAFSDAYIFRQEFMSYNDKIDEFDSEYLDVVIDIDNPVKYISSDEAVNLLSNESGIILFGSATNDSCRYLINPLISVAKEKNETIYYLDLTDEMPTYQIKDGEIIKDIEGSLAYQELVNILNDYLNVFTLMDDEETVYKSNDKKIEIPMVVAFRKGKITYVYKDINTETEENTLKTVFATLIRSKEINEECAQNGC